MVFMPHWPDPLGHTHINLDLKRVYALLEKLGNPHRKLPPVIHVAGTNGKGSTIAFIDSIFRQAGYWVHVYTSPHLVNFNERIVIAGQEISDRDLYAALEECRIAAEGIPVTFFEGTTVAALLAFSRIRADVVLLETGLGGRLDATNVIEKPALAIITSLALDHQEYLGQTLIEIAAEKAGIIKKDVPVISALQEAPAIALLQRVALTQNAPLEFIQPLDRDWKIGLVGEHQRQNAALAVAAIKKLTNFEISSRAVERGIQSAFWRARMQHLQQGKLVDVLPKRFDLWVDGGHNNAAAETIRHVIAGWSKPTYLIMGMLKNRSCAEFIRILAKDVVGIYGMAIPGDYECYTAQEIAEVAAGQGVQSMPAGTLESAIKHIIMRELHGANILVCGSLYLAGRVLAENQ